RRPMEAHPGMNIEVGRIPPQAVEAEKAVLGAALLSRDAVSVAIPLLGEESFYHPGHRKIWKTIVTLFERNIPADIVTVSEELRRRDELSAVGGLSYLTSLDAFVASPVMMEHYCEIVREKTVLRRIIAASDDAV